MSLNTLLESANPYQSLQSDAAKLAAKGRRMLERYQNVKKDLTPGDVHVETIMGSR